MFGYASCIGISRVGLHAIRVTVECTIRRGLPHVTIVGLPDASVHEARDRVMNAIKAQNLPFPLGNVTINLAPAEERKAGPGLDLAIAVAILAAQGTCALPPPSTAFLGELSLDGRVCPVRSTLFLAHAAQTFGTTTLVTAGENAGEAALLEDMNVFPAASLTAVLSLLNGHGHTPLTRHIHTAIQPNNPPIFPMIIGQTRARRAAILAAAGNHHLFLLGNPGVGKTLLARAIIDLLPPLAKDEALATAIWQSTQGMTGDYLSITRPFRSPHHSSSAAAVLGGGSVPKPGQYTLAHHGVLFLDEFPEFSKEVREGLREPMQEGVITIARALGSITLPANALVIAAANPCPCGRLGEDGEKKCTCNELQKRNYHQRLSGPMMERFPLHVRMYKESREIAGMETDTPDLPELQRQIARVRTHQKTRRLDALHGTALLTRLNMSKETLQLLHSAERQLELNQRTLTQAVRVARTIADLADSDAITPEHLQESLSYRAQGMHTR